MPTNELRVPVSAGAAPASQSAETAVTYSQATSVSTDAVPTSRSVETTPTNSQATSASQGDEVSPIRSDEMAAMYSDDTTATHSPATSATTLDTAFTKGDHTKDDDSVYSLSDMSDTEVEKLSDAMDPSAQHGGSSKPGKQSHPPTTPRPH